MRVILTGGGTGGHISPALAIAEKIRKRYKSCEILFICREGGKENSPILELGYSVKLLKVRGIERRLTPRNLMSVCLALKSEAKAKKIIRDFAPDAVIGTGGYVCWPVLHAASAMKIPTAIHESNVVPGLVTRLLSKRCTRVLLNHEESKKYLKRRDNAVTIGNPLREEFGTIDRKKARRELGISEAETYILSFGGSGGSQKMNETVYELMDRYKSGDRIVHTHACGEKYYEKFKEQKNDERSEILPYINDMPKRLAAADIVICRCGAMTLSEIAAAGVAAILIPSPNVTDNHQYKNGKLFSDCGAAIMIEESELSTELLYDKVMLLCKNQSKRTALRKKIKKFTNLDAADMAVSQISRMIKSDRE